MSLCCVSGETSFVYFPRICIRRLTQWAKTGCDWDAITACFSLAWASTGPVHHPSHLQHTQSREYRQRVGELFQKKNNRMYFDDIYLTRLIARFPEKHNS